jgi:muramoyltetrapeptide carboxypeptidase LdcA involved in peptidoglycan recycling
MKKLPKLQKGDRVAILSPSSAAPGVWPHVYQLGLKRVREVFGFEPVEFPTTAKPGSSTEERSKDLIAAFEDPSIKAIISSIGGNDQVTYIKDLPPEPFMQNPKPFFGFSDNSHFANFLFLNDIPSFYGGALFTQFAMQEEMDEYTVGYLKHALFDTGEYELISSDFYNDIGLDWADESLLDKRRVYEKSDGWYWSGTELAEGILWGGCLESVDEMLRHEIPIPSRERFKEVVLMVETSEEIPSAEYVSTVMASLGERGILSQIRGVLVGRPKAWEFDKPQSKAEKEKYRLSHREVILEAVRKYSTKNIPVVQNMNFGHTDPQIPMPYGGHVRIDPHERKIYGTF